MAEAMRTKAFRTMDKLRVRPPARQEAEEEQEEFETRAEMQESSLGEKDDAGRVTPEVLEVVSGSGWVEEIL